MTLLAPIALRVVGLFAAGLAGLVVVAYVLKMRRRRFEVPFSNLWQRVLKEKEASSLWKHLRRLLSLLLTLVIIGLILFAVTEPRLGAADRDARSVVIILDTSASMKTIDEGKGGKESRMDVARRQVLDLLGTMGGSDHAMIMRMDGQTTPLSRFVDDMPALKRVVAGVDASDTPADLRRALSAAADALHGRQNPMIILVGDGAYAEETLNSVVWTAPAPAPATTDATAPDQAAAHLADIDLSGIDVHYLAVGHTRENVGIVAFNVRRYVTNKLNYEVFIEIQNFGKEVARRKLVLYNGDSPIDVRNLELASGERLRQIYPDLSGGDDNRLRAAVERTDGKDDKDVHDAFALDDDAHALLPARRRQDVLLVTKDNLYLEGAMLVYDSIRVDKAQPEQYEAEVAKGTLPEYTAVVFDDYTPTALPPEHTHLLYFNPSGEHSPFAIRGKVHAPHITEVDQNHPVMRWLTMTDVNFDDVSVFTVDPAKGEVVLATAVRDPIMAAKRDGRRKIVACGFSLTGTDLTMRVAFPLLLVNALDWFAGDDADLITTYATGNRIEVPLDSTVPVSEAEVLSPSGKRSRAPVVDGRATFYAAEVGIHKITARAGNEVVGEIELAANLANPDESDIAPSTELNLGGKKLTPPEGFEATRRQGLWLYLLLAVVLLLSVEWVTYNRRVTV